MATEFFDNDAVLRLGEAILSQLQQDYMGTYKKYILEGPESRVYSFGNKKLQHAEDALHEMDQYIRSSMLTADRAESIIEELRRQGKEAAENGLSAKKVNWRQKVTSEKGDI